MSTPPRITDTTFMLSLHELLPLPEIHRFWSGFEALAESPDNSSRQGMLPQPKFSTDTASVHSSRIEGNTIDLNFFMNSKERGAVAKPKRREFAEIEDLVAAYTFAQTRELNEKNFLRVHKTLSKRFLIASKGGAYRNHGLMIQSAAGIEYVAVEEEYLPDVMRAFWDDIRALQARALSPVEALYHSALAHLVFVHIHPFSDGNGRCARILEKWLLARHLGARAWQIPSETYYWEHRKAYYANIKLGVNYYELDYDRCAPFLAMLPQSLRLFAER